MSASAIDSAARPSHRRSAWSRSIGGSGLGAFPASPERPVKTHEVGAHRGRTVDERELVLLQTALRVQHLDERGDAARVARPSQAHRISILGDGGLEPVASLLIGRIGRERVLDFVQGAKHRALVRQRRLLGSHVVETHGLPPSAVEDR